ncbi:hypothetical protein ACGFSB_22965 [Streptomyces sp. NPDC048441]|uniref:hypothetical protein n=1 Tax=Streptomyces sp. NPDC048441 TaxID=3365552 RepID=UPI0037180F11
MARWKRWAAVVAAACAVVAVAAVVTVSAVSGGDTDGVPPAGPKNGSPTASTDRPQDAGSGATKDDDPGSASTYWTEERRRHASPGQMPDPQEP